MLSKRLLSALRAIRRQFSSAAHGAEQELLAGGFIRPRPDGHGFELTGAGIRALSPSSSGACKTNASGSAAVRHIKHEESAVGDMEASRSARIRQATKVNKFQDRQRRRHRWVSFIDLVALFTRSGKTREDRAHGSCGVRKAVRFDTTWRIRPSRPIHGASSERAARSFS